MSRERPPPGPGGLVIVDKPAGMTSHDVVGRIRRLAGTRRVGHAGTLDPMATGVLVVGIERATRLLGYLAGGEKEYEATIRLGASTDTDDATGAVLETADCSAVQAVADDSAALAAGVAALTGPISQTPSKISAIKVDGQRAYKRVRAGEEVELAARAVTVSELAVTSVRPAAPFIDLDVRVRCSSGTYIRALARDLGAGLGIGGHLTALRRTRVGPYGLSAAHTLADLEAGLAVIELDVVAGDAFPRLDLDAEAARIVAHGGWIPALPDPAPGASAAFGPGGRFVALVEHAKGRARPIAVFDPGDGGG